MDLKFGSRMHMENFSKMDKNPETKAWLRTCDPCKIWHTRKYISKTSKVMVSRDPILLFALIVS